MKPAQDVIEQAASWAAMIDAGDMSPSERNACEAWCAEHPLHRRTLDRMRAFDARIEKTEDFERKALRSVLDGQRRRRTGVALLGLAVVSAIGWASLRSDYVGDRFPDYRTRRGELRPVALQDGSQVVLDTDGAVRVDLEGRQRRVRLIRGQLLARVAGDKARPFVVETPHGTATALGTSFVVRREADYTLVTVIESQVRVCPNRISNDRACRVLAPGQRARILPTQIVSATAVDPSSAALWSSGWLEADDQDVVAVLNELSRYSVKPIQFDAASLRVVKVTGSYPIGDIERAIEGVARSANLKVSRSTSGEIVFSRRN